MQATSPDPTDSETALEPTSTLSEQASKELLAPFGVPFLPERDVTDADAAVSAGDEMGYPVVAKLNGDAIAHKTERGLVKLNITDSESLRAAATELLAAATPDDGDVSVLIAPMVKSNREFICGMSTDPQFGPTILVGIGGILAEAIADVSIRLAPLSSSDAHEMLGELQMSDLLNEFRGEPAVDRDAMASLLVALSAAADANGEIRSIDLNPVLIVDGKPVSVDALVEVADSTDGGAA